MQKLGFSIQIKASASKVWFALWDDAHYRRWTSVFSEGSYAVSDWKEGSNIHFLSPEGSGMYARITENKLYSTMCFTHVGEVKDFKEQAASEWEGAQEKYVLTEADGVTTVNVYVDTEEPSEYADFFKQAFPKGLEIVRQSAENLSIGIKCEVKAPIAKVWEYYTQPEHIVKWNHASDDWHSPRAENNLTVGGTFTYTMAAKDGSFSFDFGGTYTRVDKHKQIDYTLGDGRKASMLFENNGGVTTITGTFDAENTHAPEFQQQGWQAILNNFKKHVEAN